VKRIANVGERIKVINDEGWERSGLWENPHPLNSEWIVTKVLIKNCFPSGMVFVKDNQYGIGADKYVVLEEDPI
ncbi:MAG: hypothetical protein WA181_21495, partial [Bacillus mycoides]